MGIPSGHRHKEGQLPQVLLRLPAPQQRHSKGRIPPAANGCLSGCGAKWFSQMDLSSGFWQIEMAPDDRGKTAFATSLDLYQWISMPVGLVNSPSTFQRYMEEVLRGLQ